MVRIDQVTLRRQTVCVRNYRNWQLNLAGAMKLVLTLARALLSGRANAQIDSQTAAHREDICRLWVQELRLALKVLQ